MTSLGWLNAYLCANILIAVVAALIGGTRAVSQRLAVPLSFRSLRLIAGLLALAALLLPILTTGSREVSLVPPIAQAWSASSMHSAGALPAGDYHLAASLESSGTSLSLDSFGQLLQWLFPLSVCGWLLLLLVDALRVRRILHEAEVLHRVGRVWLLVASRSAVPFAFWTPWRSAIVLPAALLNLPQDLRIAIRHEAQHHRQGDTLLVYILQAVKGMFLWNPAAHLLVRQLLDLQELACDEAVLRRSAMSAADYCHCLARVAASAVGAATVLQQGMAGRGRSTLLLRMKAAMYRPRRYLRAPVTLTLSLALIAATLLVSAAFGSVIGDRRISFSEAREMAEVTQRSTQFPVVMNRAVDEQLNLLLGTNDGRRYLRFARDRMQQYRPAVAPAMANHSLPMALLAVPLIESGYRNFSPPRDQGHGAGLWMFVAPTARRYGLQVAPGVDERLNVALETDAAARMLAELHAEFGDWSLALLAYNAGRLKVETGIRATGARDAWKLVDRGYGNDRNYLARAMAAVIIVGNPAILADL